MRSINFFSVLLIISAIVFLPANLFSRVSIGSTDSPQDFSVLELFSNETMGLRLPQLTTIQRDALTPYLHGNAAAMGLQIFNTTEFCVETWSGSFWISVCDDVVPPVLTPPHFDVNCVDNLYCVQLLRFASTVRQLNDGMPQPVRHATITAIDFNMMPVTGGVFYMGDQNVSDVIPNRDPNSQGAATSGPVHQVGVSSFYIGQHEVTRTLWRAVLGASGNFGEHVLTEVSLPMDPSAPAPAPALDGLIAMNNVSWLDAVVFMNRLSVITGRTPVYTIGGGLHLNAIPAAGTVVTQDLSVNGFRLPTESEWEYAARGGQRNGYTRSLGASGTLYRFSGSNDVNAVAWYNAQPLGTGQVRLVGSLSSNQLGIYDMSGNVWEWVWDLFAPYLSCCAVNPTGSASGSDRVIRSGCWHNTAAYTRVSARLNRAPMLRNPSFGVRLAVSAP